jgi:hypothetical protein
MKKLFERIEKDYKHLKLSGKEQNLYDAIEGDSIVEELDADDFYGIEPTEDRDDMICGVVFVFGNKKATVWLESNKKTYWVDIKSKEYEGVSAHNVYGTISKGL